MLLTLHESSAFNERFSVTLDDGSVVESVLYRRKTLCVSSQVGCAVGCPFCASGKDGLLRNLTLGELIGQVELAHSHAPLLRRVTISGVGEPLHNAANVGAFVRWCRGRRLAPSLTTSAGPVSKLRAALDLEHNGLTVSVHAGTEAMRCKLVPRGPSLDALFAAVQQAFVHLSNSRKRRVSLGYLLLDGVNDSVVETGAFARRTLAVGASVYLYRLNAVSGSPFRPSPKYDDVYRAWSTAGLEVRRSSMARVEPNGGCGTLVAFGAGHGDDNTEQRR